jgi:hypothetical protein
VRRGTAASPPVIGRPVAVEAMLVVATRLAVGDPRVDKAVQDVDDEV